MKYSAIPLILFFSASLYAYISSSFEMVKFTGEFSIFLVRKISFTRMLSSAVLPNKIAHDSFGEFFIECCIRISIWGLDKIIALVSIILL